MLKTDKVMNSRVQCLHEPRALRTFKWQSGNQSSIPIGTIQIFMKTRQLHSTIQYVCITITGNVWGAYFYYYYSKHQESLLLLLLPYYFPITTTFIVTAEPKKHNTSRSQSNIQRPLLLPLYHTLPQTHYHR